jgi:hypothetical protein
MGSMGKYWVYLVVLKESIADLLDHLPHQTELSPFYLIS